jgi:hypothetical protein
MAKEILGRMDCAICGMKDGVKVTADKNGHPFGYCDGQCGQQYRIGPDPARVALFFLGHPHITPPAPVTVPVPAAPPPDPSPPAAVSSSADTVAASKEDATAPAPLKKKTKTPTIWDTLYGNQEVAA